METFGRGLWRGQETGHNKVNLWRGQETGHNKVNLWRGQETGHNKVNLWRGQETGHNKRPATTKIFLLLCAALLGGCGRGPVVHVFTGQTMGTVYTVKVIAPPVGDFSSVAMEQVIRDRLEEVNALMSTYDPDSQLSRFNRHASDAPFPVDAPVAGVFAIALEVSRQSGGAFDITVGPLVNAWGFGPDPPASPPDDAAIEGLRARVGYQHLEMTEDGHLRKHLPDLYCDLSAVAKGYAVDRVAEALDARGIAHYMIEVGGEVRARGENERGVPWRIGIERPDPDRRAVARVVALRDMALATSGDYRNFRVVDGVRQSHTIDPRTGRPVAHALASVSVFHPECAWADAYATAIMALGPDEGLAFARRHGIAALFFLHDGRDGFTEITTPAFEAMMARP